MQNTVHHPNVSKNTLQGVLTSPLDSTIVTAQGAQGHVVACGDFRNTGTDDFIVGQRGPVEDILYFSANDKDGKTFSWRSVQLNAKLGIWCKWIESC
jgi:hypothetical protein